MNEHNETSTDGLILTDHSPFGELLTSTDRTLTMILTFGLLAVVLVARIIILYHIFHQYYTKSTLKSHPSSISPQNELRSYVIEEAPPSYDTALQLQGRQLHSSRPF